MENKNYVGKINDLPTIDCSDFIQGAEKRIIFGLGRFWDTHVMRHFKLDPYAAIIPHKHPWEHHALCVGGNGMFLVGEEKYEIANGYWIYVTANCQHAFWNPCETAKLEIICIVPKEGDINPLTINNSNSKDFEFC